MLLVSTSTSTLFAIMHASNYNPYILPVLGTAKHKHIYQTARETLDFSRYGSSPKQGKDTTETHSVDHFGFTFIEKCQLCLKSQQVIHDLNSYI